jgi:hypothetical protein
MTHGCTYLLVAAEHDRQILKEMADHLDRVHLRTQLLRERVAGVHVAHKFSEILLLCSFRRAI